MDSEQKHNEFLKAIDGYNSAIEHDDKESCRQINDMLIHMGAWVDDEGYWRSPVDDGSMPFQGY